MSNSEGEKRHSPTPLKRKQAREQGKVACSRDLSAAMALLAAAVLLDWSGPRLAQALAALLNGQLSLTNRVVPQASDLIGQFQQACWQCVWCLLPMLLGISLVYLAMHWLQTGFHLAGARSFLDPSRVDPLRGFARLMEPAHRLQVGFASAKVMLICLVVANEIRGHWNYAAGNQAANRMSGTMLELGIGCWQSLMNVCLYVSLGLLMLALLDYAFQWWRHEGELRMTDEELREEMKTIQGDPQLQAGRRNLQQKLAAPEHV